MMLTWSKNVSVAPLQKTDNGCLQRTLHIRKISVLFFILISLGVSGQNADQQSHSLNRDEATQEDIGSLEEYVTLNQELPSEKVFLHLDRPNYMQGDTIWFKAFLWYGYDQIPDTISGVLYVDLISSQGRIMLKRKLPIQNGTAHGDFILDSTINSGKYYMRAYTRLMYDSGSGEPFEQGIIVNPHQQNFHIECVPVIKKQPGNDSLQMRLRFYEIDPAGNLSSNYTHDVVYTLKIGDNILQQGVVQLENTKEHVLTYNLASLNTLDSLADLEISIQDDRLSYEKQFHIPLQENIDLQFFPEGGNLVFGLESKIAFKAIGPDGLGRDIAGEILTDDDVVITSFSSRHKGMGAFRLTPESNQEYFAHLWYNKRKYIVPLPLASEKGLAMSVSYSGDGKTPMLSVKQRPYGANEPKYIIGSAYGKIWFAAIVKAFRDSSRLQVPLNLIPEGICRLTVLNADFQPECERLIYVDHELGFEIDVSTDSSSYKPRSKVTLQIKAADIAGIPVQTELSIAVVDKEQISQNVKLPGIRGYKLLESELQGYIEDVDAYFEKDGSINNHTLDLLLLTQGYRRFYPTSFSKEESVFQPEKSVDVIGRLEYDGSKSRKKKYNFQKINITLLSYSEDYYMEKTTPDSLGNFRFQLPLMHGESRIVLQAATAKKKPFKGDVFIDDPITPPQYRTIQLDNKSIASTTEELVAQMQSTRKTEKSKPLLPDSIAWEMSLEEVQVSAKAKDWYRRYEQDARKVIDLDTLDPDGNKYEGLYDLLVKEFGAMWRYAGGYRTVVLPSIQTTILPYHRVRPYFPPIYIIDGMIYWNGEGFNFSGLLDLEDYPANEIKRILVMPPMHAGVLYYASDDINERPWFVHQSMVVIESYSKNTYRGNAQGIKRFILDGLDAPREFYSPRYEGPSRKSPVYDGRVTLFWEPSIRTDVNGEAKVEFYTSDRQTTLDVIVNGIEVDGGYPGVGKTEINLR